MSDELFPEPAVALPAMPLCEHVVEDYVATGLSLKEHPVRFFRERLTALGAMRNAALRGDDLRQDSRVTVAGLVLVRQRPGTAKGVIFMTLEDETDIANIIVWPKAFEQNRRTVMTARFLAVRGRLQRAGLVIHVVAETFIDLSARATVAARGRRSVFAEIFRRAASGGRAASAQEPRFSLTGPSFRIGAKRQVRNPYSLTVVMDSGLLASLGPGMTAARYPPFPTLFSSTRASRSENNRGSDGRSPSSTRASSSNKCAASSLSVRWSPPRPASATTS